MLVCFLSLFCNLKNTQGFSDVIGVAYVWSHNQEMMSLAIILAITCGGLGGLQ